ncbi:hypothetical protein [Pseudonocardia kunmingensis]|nr:hypothetical protein [Pseudonocardia kunmingensis]
MGTLSRDPRDVWRDWATDLRGGGAIESGHHMAEGPPTSWPPR